MRLAALSGDKLREAIVRAAHECGAIVEKGLVARIMDQVDGQPGSLPLLQHALYELWTERRGPWLTNDAFESTGGVVRALSKRCLLYTSDAADARSSVDLGGRRIIKKKKSEEKSARQRRL